MTGVRLSTRSSMRVTATSFLDQLIFRRKLKLRIFTNLRRIFFGTLFAITAQPCDRKRVFSSASKSCLCIRCILLELFARRTVIVAVWSIASSCVDEFGSHVDEGRPKFMPLRYVGPPVWACTNRLRDIRKLPTIAQLVI